MPEAQSQISADLKLCPLFPRKRKQRTKFHLQWEGTERIKRKSKGCVPAASIILVSRPHQWKCLFFLYESFLHNLYFFLKLQSDEQEMPTFSLAGEPLLCSFCFLGVGPPSLKVQREQADTCRAQSPGTTSAPLVEQGEGFAAFVLQRYSLLWLSFSVGKLFIKSKLDPLYVMAKFDSRAQF